MRYLPCSASSGLCQNARAVELRLRFEAANKGRNVPRRRARLKAERRINCVFSAVLSRRSKFTARG